MSHVPSTIEYAQRPVALIVGSNQSVSEASSELLTCGFAVISAGDFAAAKSLLLSHPPDVLITEIRLGEYNGLHLVLRGKSARPEMAALVYFEAPDVVLAREADGLGATVLGKPVLSSELIAAIWRTRYRGADSPPIRPPFERRRSERRQRHTVVSDDRRSADRRRHEPTLGPSLNVFV